MDIKEMRQRAAEQLKWDNGTLHKKMGELVEVVEAVRTGMEGDEEVTSFDLRVAANEITRRAALIDICGERFPKDKFRIRVVLSIADDWTTKIARVLHSRRDRPSSSTRALISTGFDFMPQRLREQMLAAYDRGVEETAMNRREIREPSRES